MDNWDRLGDVAKLNLSELDGRLRAAAIYARDNHRDVLVSLESQGELTVSPEQPEDGVLHSYEVQHADELGRIGARVQEKAEQGRGSNHSGCVSMSRATFLVWWPMVTPYKLTNS